MSIHSQAENDHFEVVDESSHKWRIEMPNIIDDMDLDPFEVRLYLKYKRIAGDAGYCNRSNSRLAKETKMGLTKLKACKARLSQPFEELGGRPLIKITPRTNEETGAAMTDLITIMDIWPENFEKFLQQKRDRERADKKDIGVVATQPPPSRHATTPWSPRDHKEEPIKKNHIKKDNVGTMPFSKKDFRSKLSKEQRVIHDKIVKWKPTWGEPPRSEDVCAWFLSCGYEAKRVEEAFIVYRQDCAEAEENGKTVDNMGGRIRSILKTNRKPRNSDESFNRSYAESIAKLHSCVEVTKRYVRIVAGNLREEVEYSLNKSEFIRQLKRLVNLTQVYA